MRCAQAFLLVLDDVLTSCSKHHRDHIKNQICAGRGHRHLEKKRECEGPGADVLEVELHDIFMALLMVNNISMFTMDFPACLPPPPQPPFFFLPRFFSHTYTAQGKNDLSAAPNSLHFYSPEWTGSTKGDIIFSGFDWPPPCHRMTSCNLPPRNTSQPAPAHNQPSPPWSWMLGC